MNAVSALLTPQTAATAAFVMVIGLTILGALGGARFDHAFAPAPITLPSHASLMTGRYPPGHGARHNGIRVDAEVPSLAKTLSAAGFATGAFVSAFPLDRRFGPAAIEECRATLAHELPGLVLAG